MDSDVPINYPLLTSLLMFCIFCYLSVLNSRGTNKDLKIAKEQLKELDDEEGEHELDPYWYNRLEMAKPSRAYTIRCFILNILTLASLIACVYFILTDK